MSFKATAAVWEHSKQKGNALLLLLAIAHFADDNGEAWPAIPTLAKKARISVRQAKRLRQALFDSGELEMVKEGGGRGNTDVVRIAVKGDIVVSPNAEIKGDIVESPFSEERVTNPTQRVTNPTVKGDIAVSPDPIESSSSNDLDDDAARTTKALAELMHEVGIALSAYNMEQYHELVDEHGIEATLAGIRSAADYGKQGMFRYVKRCVETAAQGKQRQAAAVASGIVDFALEDLA